MVLIDSVARSLTAAVAETRTEVYTEYEIRWPADLAITSDSVAVRLRALPEVRRVRLGAYASPGGGL